MDEEPDAHERRTKTEQEGHCALSIPTRVAARYYLFFLIKPRVIVMMIQKKKMTLSLTGAYVILSSVAGASAAPPTATERIIKG